MEVNKHYPVWMRIELPFCNAKFLIITEDSLFYIWLVKSYYPSPPQNVPTLDHTPLEGPSNSLPCSDSAFTYWAGIQAAVKIEACVRQIVSYSQTSEWLWSLHNSLLWLTSPLQRWVVPGIACGTTAVLTQELGKWEPELKWCLMMAKRWTSWMP